MKGFGTYDILICWVADAVRKGGSRLYVERSEYGLPANSMVVPPFRNRQDHPRSLTTVSDQKITTPEDATIAEQPRRQPAACKPPAVAPEPAMDGIREATTAGS
jgi:hypothetical protein